MEKSRAEFKALREMAGITQRDLADMLGVKERSVQRWEADTPTTHNFPPDAAWDILIEALEGQSEMVDYAIAQAEAIEGSIGKKPEAVEIRYWLTEAAYIGYSTDTELSTSGSWRMANANARAAAAALTALGYTVRFVSGSDKTLVPMHSDID